VAKLLAGPMAALRRAVQRGEPLDAHTMMLLEMFSPTQPADVRASSATRPRRSQARQTENARAERAAGASVRDPSYLTVSAER
jgi:hypothetical protein